MPPMIATPLDLSDKEHELAQEFELDIRISPVSIPAMVFNTQNQITCATCNNCTADTCHIVGTRCIHG